MQENPNEQPLREYDVMERETVYVLTEPERQPPIWTLADLGRQLETATQKQLCVHWSALVLSTAPARTLSLRPLPRSSGSRWSATSSDAPRERHVAGLGVALISGISPAFFGVRRAGAPALSV